MGMGDSRSRELPKLDGLVIGKLTAFTDTGELLVQYAGNPLGAPHRARSLAVLDADAIGRQVALLFEGGDAARPVVLGVIQDPTQSALAGRAAFPSQPSALEVDVDGERLEIRAKREISICVGKASITLTHEGKVLIRGEYLLSRSSGPNRIRGGSVELN